MFFSCITYLWWFCRLRRENGPTSRYVVGVFALARELQPDDPQSIGPYRLVGQLGQGGMGRVFLGVSPGGRPVAVKAIRAELAANPEFRARFGREVAAARRVSGVFTAQVVDADVDGPVAWMATAYVPGPSLAEAVDTHGPLPEASLLALAAGLAESLNAIHAVGVVHRDLKPSNVLLAEDGPRVIDFGISRAAESTMLTQAGLVVGSPGFMSPEQAMGSDVGPPSDIFNLGAVLAFAATGEGPFGTGTTAALLYRVVHGDAQPGPGAAHRAAADRALPGQGPPAAPHRQRPAGRGGRPAAGRDLAARVVHPHVRPGHAVPAGFRLVGACGRRRERRAAAVAGRIRRSPGRLRRTPRPAPRPPRAAGPYADRGGGADRHRRQRAADPADGGLSPGHAASPRPCRRERASRRGGAG